jgi:hypothetical protein
MVLWTLGSLGALTALVTLFTWKLSRDGTVVGKMGEVLGAVSLFVLLSTHARMSIMWGNIDSFVLLFAGLGAFALAFGSWQSRRRIILGFSLLAIAAAIKPWSIVALGFPIMRLLKRSRRSTRDLWAVGSSLATMAVFAVITLATVPWDVIVSFVEKFRLLGLMNLDLASRPSLMEYLTFWIAAYRIPQAAVPVITYGIYAAACAAVIGGLLKTLLAQEKQTQDGPEERGVRFLCYFSAAIAAFPTLSPHWESIYNTAMFLPVLTVYFMAGGLQDAGERKRIRWMAALAYALINPEFYSLVIGHIEGLPSVIQSAFHAFDNWFASGNPVYDPQGNIFNFDSRRDYSFYRLIIGYPGSVILFLSALRLFRRPRSPQYERLTASA